MTLDLHDRRTRRSRRSICTTVDLNVTAARVNGVARTFSDRRRHAAHPDLRGRDCPPHGAGDSLEVEVDYSATPPAGYYTYPRNSYTFVEPYDARYWWPCYDLPFDKATARPVRHRAGHQRLRVERRAGVGDARRAGDQRLPLAARRTRSRPTSSPSRVGKLLAVDADGRLDPDPPMRVPGGLHQGQVRLRQRPGDDPDLRRALGPLRVRQVRAGRGHAVRAPAAWSTRA